MTEDTKPTAGEEWAAQHEGKCWTKTCCTGSGVHSCPHSASREWHGPLRYVSDGRRADSYHLAPDHGRGMGMRSESLCGSHDVGEDDHVDQPRNGWVCSRCVAIANQLARQAATEQRPNFAAIADVLKTELAMMMPTCELQYALERGWRIGAGMEPAE